MNNCEIIRVNLSRKMSAKKVFNKHRLFLDFFFVK